MEPCSTPGRAVIAMAQLFPAAKFHAPLYSEDTDALPNRGVPEVWSQCSEYFADRGATDGELQDGLWVRI
eukprot:12409374-Alexandrium_andersonii.AAC.1